VSDASTIEWFGCATFRLRCAGLTILLDAYIDRAEGAAGPGVSTEAVAAEGCDWIVVGHSHFDHLYGAERIMSATDARLIGSYESVRVMERAGVPVEHMICVAGGETVELGRGITVSVFPSQHSCVWSHAQMSDAGAVCIGDVGVTWQQQRERFAALGEYLASLGPAAIAHLAASSVGHSERGDGGALVFLFTLPDGRLLYQDTSGHWTGIISSLRPDTAILAAAGRGNIDGEPIQGSLAEFVGRQVELLAPRRVLLGHHDDWLPGFSTPTDTTPIRADMLRRTPGVELVEPGYLEPVPVFA
jgi:glyoxylase-like metal-dependent hydrolase (beta-lactamase superfamily II)